MSKQTRLYLHTGNRSQGTQFTNATGTTKQQILASFTEDMDLKFLTATSSAPADVVLELFLYNGTTYYQIGAATVYTGAGTNGTTSPTDLVSLATIPGLLLDQVSKPYLPVMLGWSVYASLKTIIASGTVTVNASAQAF